MHCPQCGKPLQMLREFPVHWATLLKCNVCRDGFMHLEDARCLFPPLIPLRDRRAERALELADEETVKIAFSKIRQIDIQTISVVAFEEALLAAHHSSHRPPA